MRNIYLLLTLIGFLLNNNPVSAGESNASAGGGITMAPNIPHVIDFGYETLNRASHLTYAFSAGYVPPVTISGYSISILSFDARARYHPFGGAFFLGLTGGYQSFTGSTSLSVTVLTQSVPITVKDTLSSMYLTPHLGWMWFFGSLIAGFEVGYQAGLGSKNDLNFTINDPTLAGLESVVALDPNYQKQKADLDNTVTKFTTLPYVAIKLGWKL